MNVSPSALRTHGRSSPVTVPFSLVRRGVGVVLASALLSLSACRDGTTEPPVEAVASVAASPTALLLHPGDTKRLVPVVKSASGAVLTGRMVTWRTDTPAVAVVDNSGLITATGPGYVTILVECEGKTFGVAATVTIEES